MKIVLDVMGCDNPNKVILGAVKAVENIKNVNIVLAGEEGLINSVLKKQIYDKKRLEILPAGDVITNEDIPTEAIRQKLDSSLVKAFDFLKADEETIALISAGSTGAILTGTFFKVGRIKGVSRPAIAPILPTVDPNKKVLIIDCGANVDCKPENLNHFALMGSLYMGGMFGINQPKVGLLSNGTEDKKGNQLTKEAFELIKKLPINFVGNIEARDALSGKVDVVVCDGFDGNILLKSIEGSVKFALSCLKTEIKKSFISKIGVIFMKKAFKNLKEHLNYHNYGGSPFIGAKKIIIKAHGSSDENAILKCVEQAVQIHETKVYAKIAEQIANINIPE